MNDRANPVQSWLAKQRRRKGEPPRHHTFLQKCIRTKAAPFVEKLEHYNTKIKYVQYHYQSYNNQNLQTSKISKGLRNRGSPPAGYIVRDQNEAIVTGYGAYTVEAVTVFLLLGLRHAGLEIYTIVGRVYTLATNRGEQVRGHWVR